MYLAPKINLFHILKLGHPSKESAKLGYWWDHDLWIVAHSAISSGHLPTYAHSSLYRARMTDETTRISSSPPAPAAIRTNPTNDHSGARPSKHDLFKWEFISLVIEPSHLAIVLKPAQIEPRCTCHNTWGTLCLPRRARSKLLDLRRRVRNCPVAVY